MITSYHTIFLYYITTNGRICKHIYCQRGRVMIKSETVIKMIKLSNINIPAERGNAPWTYIASVSGAENMTEKKILKKSVDARKKSDVHYVFTVAFSCDNEKAVLGKIKTAETYTPKKPYEFPYKDIKTDMPVVIVGMGPAGLFAALSLTGAGVRCILADRGQDVCTRTHDVERFWNGGELSENSNVQYGEGGAGTFSDGKLTTGINDERIPHVFDTFIKFGASEDIAYLAKPHIGTDVLKHVVENIRNELISRGCDVRFGAKLTDIDVKDGKVCGCVLGGEYIKTDSVILAVGNSARDTFEMLMDKGVKLSCKSFAAGVRIEHLQESIDISQYGKSSRILGLPAPDYKLAVHLPGGRTVYTFCVCPGGYVVAAASEKGGVVTNGMSEYARDNININGALLVTLTPEDFDNEPRKAIAFQRKHEADAYKDGGENYHAPAQLVGDFLADKMSICAKSVEPTYKPAVKWGNLRKTLPDLLADAIAAALPEMGKKIKGFDAPDAVLTAVESRSSSPVRIDRENYESVSVCGLYPCGEGAGYAGGIMSAAVDGIKCAEAICEKLK